MLLFEKLIFSFSVLGGFSGSGTLPGGFFGKFQYQTPRFRGVSCSPVPQRWYARFLPSFSANSKVQFLRFFRFHPKSENDIFSCLRTFLGGFFGKFQYRTPRFRAASFPHLPQRWSAKFLPSFLANSKVQFLRFFRFHPIMKYCDDVVTML